jgi:hypothetical protein
MKRPQLWAVTAASLLVSLVGLAAAETETVTPSQGDSIIEDSTPAPIVQRPRDVMVWTDVDPATISPVVNTNKIYLNNCKPNGCVVRSGNASSIDGSNYQGTWGISGTRTLTPFAASDATWTAVVACMKDVFSPIGVEITTTNPSPAPHFEIMIAGSPGDLGMSNGIGGVSPFSCEPYIPNSLVFDFQKVWGSDVEEICSTAAQEIAHSFALDHVTDPSDPLTYNPYNGRRRFKNAQIQCGSDCQGGRSPFGDTCSGPTGQNHACSCPNGSTIMTNTQNSVLTMQALFGNGMPTPPTVKITDPKLGAVVNAGFPVHADIADDNGVARAELYVDNTMVSMLGGSPWAFNAPATLANGTHKVKVIGYDIFGTSASDEVSVVIGKPCSGDSDCPNDTDVCLGGRCVAGPDVVGGLGQPCSAGPDCKSGSCASDSTGAKHCTESCTVGAGECPDGFGCLESAPGQGVCWPGFDDGTGGGCCSAGSDPAGPMFLGGGVCGMLLLRRRRRAAR